MAGILYVVGTPLGHLDDLSPRALSILRDVDFIAAEDPAVTKSLLDRHDIATPVTSYQNLNKEAKTPVILKRLEEGETAALVCDAGTPGIVDPGCFLVRQALDRGITVSPIPGPSAVTTALSVSGLSADRFLFLGAWPHGVVQRRKTLARIAAAEETSVLFVSGSELAHLLYDFEDRLDRRRIVLVLDATTPEELVIAGDARRLGAFIEAHDPVRESTIVIEGQGRSRPRAEKKRMKGKISRRRAFGS